MSAETSRKGPFLPGLLLLAVPVLAREEKAIQKTSTDTQVRAGDSWLNNAAGGTKYGTSTTMNVQSLASNGNARTVVKFDFTPVLSAGIKSATLALYVTTPPSSTRTYDAHRLTTFWHEPEVTWNDAIKSPAKDWTANGGDYVSTATASASTPASAGDMTWTITSDVQLWYSGTANHGTLIKDTSESAVSPGYQGVFASKDYSVEANRPKLTLQFVQHVRSLTATAGNGTATLTWTFPATVGTVLESTTGTLILRKSGSPIAASTVPTDGTDPSVGSTVGDATVVFNNTASATSFADSGLTNGTTYFYKVFARDSANYYAANGSSSNLVPEISATPSATAPEAPVWIAATGATSLAPAGLIPDTVAAAGSNSNLVIGPVPSSGNPRFFPFTTGGAVSSRAPIIPTSFSALSKDMLYLACQDDLTYAVNASSGEIVWLKMALASGALQGGAAVQIKSVSNASFTPTVDLVILGTRKTSTTQGNVVYAHNGTTGASVWSFTGSASNKLDIINSTPAVDYTLNEVWVTSRAAGGTSQPSVWKFSTNNGTLLATANLGDIDGDLAIAAGGYPVFVGTNAGVLYALSPYNATVVNSYNPSDGAVTGSPVVLNSSLPYTVVFSTSTKVHAVSFDGTSFTSTWSTAVSSPSSPLSYTGLGKVYVGSSDGKVHQLRTSDGVDEAQRIADTSSTVGAASLDVTLSRLYVGATNGRVFAFAYPF